MASMNAGIILAGQQPNFLNTIATANQAAAQQNQFQQQNALRDFNRENGAAVLAGDQNALNGYAGIAGPEAALGIQSTRQGMDINRGNLEMRNKEFEMRVQQHKAGLSAQQAAAEAEKIKQGVFAASGAQTPEQWDQIVTGLGQPELVGQFQNKEPLLRQYMTAAQILESQQGPKTNYKEIDGQFVDMNDPGAGATPIPNYVPPPKSGMRVSVGPDNKLVFEQGPGVAGGSGAAVGNSAKSELDKSEIKARNALARLDKINTNLIENPDIISAQTLQGNIKALGLEWKDYITGNLDDKDAEYLTRVVQQRGDVLENLNFTIQEITGAAMGVEEAKRIGATMPNINDSPTVFRAKLERALESTRMAVARYNYWRNNGLEGDPMSVAPLSGMKDFMADRAAEIYQEELATGDPASARNRAKARLSEEFGIE